MLFREPAMLAKDPEIFPSDQLYSMNLRIEDWSVRSSHSDVKLGRGARAREEAENRATGSFTNRCPR
jgi:hypothetical protein